jgi:excisionase family DNA binding protein
MAAPPAELETDPMTLARLHEIAHGRLLIRQSEAANALGISRRKLVEEIEAGRLRWVKVGKQRRFKPSDLITYLKRQEIGGWRHQRADNLGRSEASSSSAAVPISKTSALPVILDFAAALAQATGIKPKPLQRRPARKRSLVKSPADSPKSR